MSTAGVSSLNISDENDNSNLKVGTNSYDIFVKFVKYDPNDGTCDASDILSRECFDQWINTRRVESTRPEDIFRRTVVAHVTGTKNRKPFPEEIEASLLKALRSGAVWPCFINMQDSRNNKPIKIGANGFKVLGFHERSNVNSGQKAPKVADESQKATQYYSGYDPKALQLSWMLGKRKLTVQETQVFSDLLSIVSEEMDELIGASYPHDTIDEISDEAFVSGHSKKKKLTRSNSVDEVYTMLLHLEDDPETRENHIHNLESWRKHPETLVDLCFVFGVRKSDGTPVDLDLVNRKVFNSDHPDLIDLFRVTNYVDPTIQVTLRVIFHITSSQSASHVIRINPVIEDESWGHSGVPRNIAEYISENEEILSDPRLEKSFMVPKIEGDIFDPNRIIGHNIVDYDDMIYTYADENSIRIVGDDVTGRSPQHIQCSAIGFWSMLRYGIPHLFLFREVLVQMVSNRSDGSLYVCRALWKIRKDKHLFIDTYFQDVSHLYPDLLCMMPMPL